MYPALHITIIDFQLFILGKNNLPCAYQVTYLHLHYHYYTTLTVQNSSSYCGRVTLRRLKRQLEISDNFL